MLTEAVLAVIAIIFILIARMSNRPKLPKTYPKGPPGWPVIGNLLQLGSQPHLKLTEWSRQYGSVYSLNLCKTRVVVLNSYKALSEAMVDRKADFAGRPRDFISMEITTGYKAFSTMDYDEFCKVVRKSAHTALRVNGTERWSEVITMQVDKLIDKLSERGSSPCDPHLPLSLVAFNTVSEITQKRSYEEDDQEFVDFIQSNEDLLRNLVGCSPVDYARWLKPFFKSQLDRLQKAAAYRVEYMEGRIRARKEKFNSTNPPRDAIDMMLIAKETFQNNPTSGISAELFDDKVVVQSVMDFFSAGIKYDANNAFATARALSLFWDICLFFTGSETIVSSMKWFLVEMMLNPEIQRKIHQEIDDVVGVDRRPVYADHDNLPYLKAAMYESLRLHSIAPLSVLHRTLCTTSVIGCQIPDDTLIIPNHWAIDHDPDTFEDPYVFRPGRFIDGNTGRCVSFNEMNFTPFGMGRRVCLGEMLAKIEYFLIAANLLHQFEVTESVVHGKPSIEGVLGLTYNPKPFKMTVERRNRQK
ncbi:steroid 17-alpha-hydroxylase/17,20 lyase-like [Glandiceps talaboti]